MTFTRHGHHIPGTTSDDNGDMFTNRARCGGPRLCDQCSKDAAAVQHEAFVKTGTRDNYPELAKKYVRGWINQDMLANAIKLNNQPPVPYEFDVYVVWFAKTLQNWKALVSSTISDGRYFEVTHNGDKNETYIDVYEKRSNFVIKH